MTTIAINPSAKLKELFRYIDDNGAFIKKFMFGIVFKIKSAKYKKPYDKNMFKITTKMIDLIESFKKISFKSSLKPENEFLNLKIKKKINTIYIAVEFREMIFKDFNT